MLVIFYKYQLSVSGTRKKKKSKKNTVRIEIVVTKYDSDHFQLRISFKQTKKSNIKKNTSAIECTIIKNNSFQ